MDDQTTPAEGGREAYEARKQEKRAAQERARATGSNTASMKQWLWYVVGLIIIVLIGYGVYVASKGAAPQGPDASREIPIMNREHISVGATHPEYNSNPPTSGWHYAETARTGFRTEVIPDEHLVHNLEHGDVWISYHPRIPDAVKSELQEFAGLRVVIVPREANESDIALAAWGRLDTFNLDGKPLPVGRIQDFIKRYLNKGPEKIPASQHGGGV